jgi:DNA-binding response OmpR family regulator
VSDHILLVDDDELLLRSLALNLKQAGYRVSTVTSAEDALALAGLTSPNLILLDIGLSGMNGLEALRHFRAGIGVPVILLTARQRELDEVLGLKYGADDYITKPFDVDVLLARIKAVLRRFRRQAASTSPTEPAPLVVGDLTVDPAAHTVSVGGHFIDLPPRQFDLLHALALEAGQVLSADELLARVWGGEHQGESQVIYVHIRWLREKLEEDSNCPQRIVTVRGVGYKLEAQEAG